MCHTHYIDSPLIGKEKKTARVSLGLHFTLEVKTETTKEYEPEEKRSMSGLSRKLPLD